MLPTDPGLYYDIVGDVWRLGEDGRWEHYARQLPSGETALVEGEFTGRMSAEGLAYMATGPGVDVLPLTRVVGDYPPA